MATYSSILACKIPMDREAWETTVHRVAQSDMTEATQHMYTHIFRKIEETKPKQKQHPVVDVTGDGSKV